MKLSDFATLVEAQDHAEVTDKKQIGAGQARGFLVSSGIWTALRQIQSDMTHPLYALADAVIVTASDGSSYFGMDSNTAEGQANLASAQILVDAGVMTEAQKTELFSKALVSTNPYENTTQAEFDEAKDVGETLDLPANSAQHKSIINITTQPNKSINIVIEQRFGPSVDDLTDWHECGAFRGVFYPQQSYTAQIAASPAGIRELRAVSPLTVGMSLEV